MSILSTIEVNEICKHLGESAPKNIQEVSGGSIHKAFKIDFESRNIFIKINRAKKLFLSFEKYCLNSLEKYANKEYLIIPNVIDYFKFKNSEILIMEWIDMTNNDQTKLGRGLAEIHKISQESHMGRFGYEIDGFIGKSDQIQGWEINWADCFINLRLEPQLRLLQGKVLNLDIKNKLKSKISKCLLKHSPKISLVHGDLWSGNIGVHKSSKGVLFDPACWWADSEVDIAMTRLFGGFNYEFYDEYNKIIPKKEGLEERIFIYNFYHILNHANIFGGNYITEVKNYTKRIMNL
tara:strand:- start:381 stop:1259 length:879 start_codon:yes stop_codon:yes gene_type:complete